MKQNGLMVTKSENVMSSNGAFSSKILLMETPSLPGLKMFNWPLLVVTVTKLFMAVVKLILSWTLPLKDTVVTNVSQKSPTLSGNTVLSVPLWPLVDLKAGMLMSIPSTSWPSLSTDNVTNVRLLILAALLMATVVFQAHTATECLMPCSVTECANLLNTVTADPDISSLSWSLILLTKLPQKKLISSRKILISLNWIQDAKMIANPPFLLQMTI